MRRVIVTVFAASGLVLGSSAGAASSVRSASEVGEGEHIAANPWVPWVFALAALAAIILVVADDDEDEPASP